MKTFLKFSFIFYLIIFCNNQLLSQTYSNPESIIWDESNSRYLISNVNNHVNGYILSYDPSTNTIENFINTGLDSPKGMYILDGILYVTDITRVKGYNIEDKTQTMNIEIPGSAWLNDITGDGSGSLYISDTDTGNIHLLVIATGIISTFANTSSPNGLLYDINNNRLLVCSWGNNANIKAIDLTNQTVSTVINTGFSNFDGLVIDNCGNYYISSWGSNTVYRYDKDFEIRQSVWLGLNGPADIYFNLSRHELVSPNFNNNTILFKSFFQTCLSPILISPENNSVNQASTSLSLDWENFPGVGDYEYYYSTENSFPPGQTMSAVINTSEVSLTNLQLNTKYYWKVKARSSQGQSEWSEIFNFTTELFSGITEFSVINKEIVINPNPAYDIITVNSKNDYYKMQFDIIDLSGRKIKSGNLEFQSAVNSINISDMDNGFYLIRFIVDNNYIYQQKLIINK